MNQTATWTVVERPGYFGKKRDEIIALWNEKYGEGNWRLMWQWGNTTIDRAMAIQIYEDAYYSHLKWTQGDLFWLIHTASNVYDTAPSNVDSGLDYSIQETPNNHLHDIAIRRALVRLGDWFKGDRLIHVRSTDTEGSRLSPFNVMFHMPHMIVKKEGIKDYGSKGQWWKDGSVEDFYQKNKVLQVLQKEVMA